MADATEVDLKPFWRGLPIAIAASFATMVMVLTVPAFVIAVMQWVIRPRSIPTLVWLTGAAMLGIVAFFGMELIRSFMLRRMGNWLAEYLGLAALETSIVNALRGGKVSVEVLQDVHRIRAFVGGRLGEFLEMFWVPPLLVILLIIHPLMGVITAVGIAIIVLLGVVNDRLTRRATLEADASATAVAHDTAGLIRRSEVVHALGLRTIVALRWTRGQRGAEDMRDEANRRTAAIAALTRFVEMCIFLFMLAIGAFLFMAGSISVARVFGGALIIRRTLRPCANLVENWREWLLAAAAYRRVQTVVKETRSRRSTVPLSRPDGRLEVDRLVFVPPGGDRAVLRGISFTVNPGEVLGVIGPSGAGKSTLARMLVGLWPPSSGGIYLDGQSVFLWERTSFGEHVGYLPQNPGLFTAEVRENIARLADGDEAEVVRAAKSAGIHDAIARLPFGYSTEVGEGTLLLSGGQRQRVALARALFGRPHMLVLDEPDAHLDEQSRVSVYDAILEAKANGAIVVVISHQLATIRAVADKILVLRSGIAERFGEKQAVLTALQPRRQSPPPLKLVPQGAVQGGPATKDAPG